MACCEHHAPTAPYTAAELRETPDPASVDPDSPWLHVLDEAAVESRFDGLPYNADAAEEARRLQAEYAAGWQSDLAEWRSGNIDLVEFERRRYDAIAEHFAESYKLGIKAAGRTFIVPTDEAHIRAAVNAEQGYLAGFVADMGAGAGRMPYEQRAAQYGAAGNGLYLKGEIAGLDTKWTDCWWDLSAAESCDDCIALASNGPYSPLSIPTAPRLGQTRCRGNCKCNLRYTKRDRPRGGAASMEDAVSIPPLGQLPDVAARPASVPTRIEMERIDRDVAKIENELADLQEQASDAYETFRARREAVDAKFNAGEITGPERYEQLAPINADYEAFKDRYNADLDALVQSAEETLPDPSRMIRDIVVGESGALEQALEPVVQREIAGLGKPPTHPLGTDGGGFALAGERAVDPDDGPIDNSEDDW